MLKRCVWRAWALLFSLGVSGTHAQQDGTLQWAYSLDNAWTSTSPAMSPDGQTIYLGLERRVGGQILAVPSNGGRARWRVDRPAAVLSSPAVAPDGTIYIGCQDGRLYALDPANGATKWEKNTHTFVQSSPAIGPDGTIYFGAGDFHLWAVSPAGDIRWRFPTGSWIDSSPAVGPDGTVYFGSYDRIIYAVTPDGEEKWRHATRGHIAASPAIGADGTVYVGSSDQRIYALSPDGVLRWEFLTNGDLVASPSIGADGTVYCGSMDGSFYALNPTGGDGQRVKWIRPVNASIASTAAVRGDGLIVFGADDGNVRGLEPNDGSIRWTFPTTVNPLMDSSPIIARDGSIYIGGLDGFLYKINGNQSPLSAYSSWPAFRRDVQRTGRAGLGTGGGALLNLSTRGVVGGTANLIVGFFIQGLAPKAYLVRGIGPGLAPFGVGGFLPDPRLQLFSGDQLVRGGSNDNWSEAQADTFFGVADTAAGVGAFALPDGSRDAAVVLALELGSYTALVSSVDGRSGVTLVEAYDARGGDPGARLVNLSTRGQVGTGENALFAGVVVGGAGASRLLIRAVGPGLSQFGVGSVLANPALSVYAARENGPELLDTNTGWATGGLRHDLVVAAQQVAAFPLASNSTDSATIVTVRPGPYTVQIAGVGGTSGEALVEIYLLP